MDMMPTFEIGGFAVPLDERGNIVKTYVLTATQKAEIRGRLVALARQCLGIKYDTDKTGGREFWRGKWVFQYPDGTWRFDRDRVPETLDCSGLVTGVYSCCRLAVSGGSQTLSEKFVPTGDPIQGDLAFFGHDKDPRKIYHVGLFDGDGGIIEARAPDASASFPTGQVIVRPRDRWEKWKNFIGYGRHPQMMGA